MGKKVKFGDKIESFSKLIGPVQIIIVIAIGIVLYLIIKKLLDIAKDPAKFLYDQVEEFLDSSMGGARACGTCKPSDAQRKANPKVTNICGNTGIPFLNAGCFLGLGVIVVFLAAIAAGVTKLYKWATKDTNEKLSDTYKRTTGKKYSDFKEELEKIKENIDTKENEDYEKWKEKQGDGDTSKEAFEKEYVNKYADQLSPDAEAKIRKMKPGDAYDFIKSTKLKAKTVEMVKGQTPSPEAKAAADESGARAQGEINKTLNQEAIDEEEAAEELTEEEVTEAAKEAESFEFEEA
jgi:hypothetical protein